MNSKYQRGWAEWDISNADFGDSADLGDDKFWGFPWGGSHWGTERWVIHLDAEENRVGNNHLSGLMRDPGQVLSIE